MIRALIFLPIALVLVFPVHATTPSLVTGTITITSFSPSEVRTADNNTILTATGTLSFMGGIQGESTYMVTFIIHTSTGLIDFKGQAAFTGAVTGSQPGSMDILITGNATQVITSSGPSLTSLIERLVLGNGTGGLVGIHGEGTDLGTGPNTLTYSVNIQFDRA